MATFEKMIDFDVVVEVSTVKKMASLIEFEICGNGRNMEIDLVNIFW